MIENIMNKMEEINYGVPNKENENLLNLIDNDEVFNKYYYLQTPEELIKSKLGTCFDQVELEREYFSEINLEVETYFIIAFDEDGDAPSHTFLTYKNNDKVYWFEHAWYKYKGIHEYSNIKELLLDVKEKFLNSHENVENNPCFIYKYSTPKPHLTCDEFYEYAENGELIKLNEPLYFYHIVNKNADLSKGLLSLEYMYKNKMYDLFDKYTEKYKSRITDNWNIEKYKGRKSLTREEIIDALNIFRGPLGSSYIYFFKFPPYECLGKRMKEILKVKDIYRININDEEIIKSTKDIFYGYDKSSSDNKLLTKSYYENLTEEEYFKDYDDSLEMNFALLNHIGISFINDYCKLEFLEKM